MRIRSYPLERIVIKSLLQNPKNPTLELYSSWHGIYEESGIVPYGSHQHFL